MLPIKELLQNYIDTSKNSERSKITNRRQEIIKQFVDKLNALRVESGFQPMAPGFIASKMYNSGLKTDWELCWFYGYCNEAKNFGATWWWALTPKKEEAFTTH